MIEQRKNNRVHVNWKGVVKESDDVFYDIKLIEIGVSGMLFSCPETLNANQNYMILLSIPNLAQPTKEANKVPCKIKVSHAVLSGTSFRVGAQMIEIADNHRELIVAWIAFESKIKKN